MMARVIDMASHSAVYATRLLAESGHDVVRVEPPQGDELRRLGPFLGNQIDLEHGAYHQFLNAGKRSITLNLSSSSGRRVFLELVARSDVLIGSVPLPFEERELLEANRRLVLTEVFDGEPELCAFARSGLLSITGHPGKRPTLLGGHAIYAAIGLYAAVATSAALFELELTGEGQVVNVSAQDCLESLFEQAMVTYTSTGQGTERRGYRGAVTAVSGGFPCSDGYSMFSIPHTPEGWAHFMEWVQDPVLMADLSLVEESERYEKRDFILDRLEAWSQRFPKADMVAEAQRRHIPAAPVSTVLDLVDDPQLLAREFLTEIDHPQFGRIMFPRGAIATIREKPVNLAPRLGQHNHEILSELGYSEAEQQILVETGAL
jgi:crotonobetainyl-CoA:carnitine CoA-transferase CaiB-like acyl-CoA transferase